LQTQLSAIAPDIVCLQEAFAPEMAHLLAEACDLQHRAVERLPGLEVLSCYPILSHQTVPYRVKSPHETHDRRLMLTLIDSSSAASLRIGCTHLSWKADDEPTRITQVDGLFEAARALAASPLLIGGDFNAMPESEPMRRLHDAGFVEVFAKLHPHEPGYTWDNWNPFIQSHSTHFPDRRIDYLRLNSCAAAQYHIPRCDVVLNTPDVNGVYPSDHYGVLGELNHV